MIIVGTILGQKIHSILQKSVIITYYINMRVDVVHTNSINIYKLK